MKILIIKPSSFGDIIQANPIIAAIKEEWSNAKIDWLVFDKFKPTVELFGNITNIKVWKRNGGIKAFFDILKDCNKQNYDLVMDLQGLLRTA
ncbi:glycosyltransferase family 9 protein, partial [Candidatus Ruminimicrobium bovinum]|uniref:glycosyltransferase family 9 protein n=1 Tax=Candidatus Ruminimicrobium bovinum TaxID=3242779 RepID=UPI0039B828E8